MRATWSVAVAVSAFVVCSPASNAASRSERSPKSSGEAIRFAQIELKGAYPEGAEPLSLFGNPTETLSQIVARLDKAADDEKVSGVILRINDPTLGWAKVNELQHAIQHIRHKGKKVIAYLDSATTHDYLVAAACDQIVMPESGEVAIVGLRAEVTFFKNLFDWLHLKADMLRVGEYKSAAEPFSRTEMSKEFRHEMEEILDDYLRQIVDGISKSRKLDADKVRAAIDNGPYTADRACKLGLIDKVAYEDEIEGMLKQSEPKHDVEITKNYAKKKTDNDFSGFGGIMKMMNLLMGGEQSKRLNSKPKIAVVHAVGSIMSGKSSTSFFGGETLGSETFIKAVRQAAEEKTVKAIVLRVDSPGGKRTGQRPHVAGAAESGQAGHRQHGGRRGQRRILHFDGGQPHLRGAGNADRFDRRRRRKSGDWRPVGKGRHHDERNQPRQKQRRQQHALELHRQRAEGDAAVALRHLQPVHAQGGRGPQDGL